VTTPVSQGILPVRRLLRAGEQTGLVECELIKVTP